jgi:D-glycero-D-manno-heptose 1,7-bisphosphate phosphatase
VKALFLDRDGVINEEVNYAHKIEQIKFVEGIFDLAAAAIRKDYKIFVVTNQAGIGRGYYTEADFHALTNWIEAQFAANNAPISKTYFCPNHPEHGQGKYKIDCNFRKPKPGMILQAVEEYGIELASSILIGDRETDIHAAKNAGIGTKILFTHDAQNTKTIADKIVTELSQAIELL